MNIHLTLKNRDITMENIEGDEIRIVAIYHSLYQFLVKCLRTMESKDIDTLQYLNKCIRERVLNYKLNNYLINNEQIIMTYAPNKKITIGTSKEGYVDINITKPLIKDIEGIDMIFRGNTTTEVKLEKLRNVIESPRFSYLNIRRPYVIDIARIVSEEDIKNRTDDKWRSEYFTSILKSRDLRHRVVWNMNNTDDKDYILELKEVIEDTAGVRLDDKLKWERIDTNARDQYEITKFINLSKPLYVILMLCGMGDNIILFEQPFKGCSEEDISKMKQVLEVANKNGNTVLYSSHPSDRLKTRSNSCGTSKECAQDEEEKDMVI